MGEEVESGTIDQACADPHIGGALESRWCGATSKRKNTLPPSFFHSIKKFFSIEFFFVRILKIAHPSG